jgi:hypothetical protein
VTCLIVKTNMLTKSAVREGFELDNRNDPTATLSCHEAIQKVLLSLKKGLCRTTQALNCFHNTEIKEDYSVCLSC